MNNHLESLHNRLTRMLAPIADQQGEVLYSAAEYLRPSEVYLLGYNPGQGGPNTRIIGVSVKTHPSNSFYTDPNYSYPNYSKFCLLEVRSNG